MAESAAVLQPAAPPVERAASSAELDHNIDARQSAQNSEVQLLTVLRHGKRLDEVEAMWRSNAERPWDPPLWQDGLAAIELMAEKLKQYNFQRMVVSPFQRCLKTAQRLNNVLQLPLRKWQVDPAVCEVLDPKTLVGAQLVPPVGVAEEWMWAGGSLGTALRASLGEDHGSQIPIADTSFPPFPETAEQAHERYAMAFEVVADRFPGENILIVSHGEAVGRAVSRILPRALVYNVQHCGFATAYRQIEADGCWGMWQLNESECQGVDWTFR